jgi:hypothetical protein
MLILKLSFLSKQIDKREIKKALPEKYWQYLPFIMLIVVLVEKGNQIWG